MVAAPLPFRVRDLLLVGFVLAFVLAAFEIRGLFCLSGEAAALRGSAMSGLSGHWSKKIALRFGWLETCLLRTVSHAFKLAPEPRAALDSLRGAEVGVYRLHGEAGWAEFRTILARTDKAMSGRRWDRVVGVSHERELVAVYVPRRGLSAETMRCCVLVLQGQDLIIAGASGNLGPLFEVAAKRVQSDQYRASAYQGRFRLALAD